MKRAEAIQKALEEFENDKEGKIYKGKEGTYALEKFGERVLYFYSIPNWVLTAEKKKAEVKQKDGTDKLQ